MFRGRAESESGVDFIQYQLVLPEFTTLAGKLIQKHNDFVPVKIPAISGPVWWYRSKYQILAS